MSDTKIILPKGLITIKRFGKGVGFEFEYPIVDTDTERAEVRQQFIKSMRDIEVILDTMIGVFDGKRGYEEPDPELLAAEKAAQFEARKNRIRDRKRAVYGDSE